MKKLFKKFGLLTLFYTLTLVENLTTFAAEEGGSGAANETNISIELNEPIGDTHTIEGETAMEFISNYISLMYQYGATVVGIICVLVIAVSGMQYAMDSNSAEEAKKRIINSLSALALLFSSGILLWFLNPNFFVFN